MKNLAYSSHPKAPKLDNSAFQAGHRLILSLCHCMRLGQEATVNPTRINKYVQHIWKVQLLPYFNFEQTWVFPQVDNPEDTQELIRQHEKIQRMIAHKDIDFKSLNRLEEYLEMHVRFESKISRQIIPHREAQIRKHQPKVVIPNWQDKFWQFNASGNRNK